MDDTLESRLLRAAHLARAIGQGGVLVPRYQRANGAEVGNRLHALQQFLDARIRCCQVQLVVVVGL